MFSATHFQKIHLKKLRGADFFSSSSNRFTTIPENFPKIQESEAFLKTSKSHKPHKPHKIPTSKSQALQGLLEQVSRRLLPLLGQMCVNVHGHGQS